MEKGDIVTVNDGSGSVRVDQYSKYSDLHGICEDEFEVLHVRSSHEAEITSYGGIKIHDLFIKNTKTGSIYLHSKAMVNVIRKAKPEIKELSLADLERKHGCKIKIIK